MSFLMKCFFFIFFLLPIALFGNIITIDSISPLWEELRDVDEETLILFDVDDTLIIPQDQILRSKSRGLFNKIAGPFNVNLSKEEFELNMSLGILQRKVSLINSESPALIAAFQNKKSKVLALTAMQSGKLGLIPCMEKWRADELKIMGFDFSQTFYEMPYTLFDEFSNVRLPPSFYQGILASSQVSKGETLVAFLKTIHWMPKRVIFIDDKRKQLESVESSLEKMHIPVTCYHYREASTLPVEVEAKTAYFQIEYLQKNKKWLSDEEAKKLLPNI